MTKVGPLDRGENYSAKMRLARNSICWIQVGYKLKVTAEFFRTLIA